MQEAQVSSDAHVQQKCLAACTGAICVEPLCTDPLWQGFQTSAEPLIVENCFSTVLRFLIRNPVGCCQPKQVVNLSAIVLALRSAHHDDLLLVGFNVASCFLMSLSNACNMSSSFRLGNRCGLISGSSYQGFHVLVATTQLWQELIQPRPL